MELQALRKEFSLRSNEDQDHSLTREGKNHGASGTNFVDQKNQYMSQEMTLNSDQPISMREIGKEPPTGDVFELLR